MNSERSRRNRFVNVLKHRNHSDFATMAETTQPLSKELLINEMKKSLPILSTTLHKGDCGRIGVIGGSFEYTGGNLKHTFTNKCNTK